MEIYNPVQNLTEQDAYKTCHRTQRDGCKAHDKLVTTKKDVFLHHVTPIICKTKADNHPYPAGVISRQTAFKDRGRLFAKRHYSTPYIDAQIRLGYSIAVFIDKP
jgi:hypothetical protein